jgi:hypothetical protein
MIADGMMMLVSFGVFYGAVILVTAVLESTIWRGR